MQQSGPFHILKIHKREKYSHKHYNSLIHNYQNLEANKMSLNRLMDKLLAYLTKGVFSSSSKKQTLKS
jgi:hypothetical protein